jgi:hypothetical protein
MGGDTAHVIGGASAKGEKEEEEEEKLTVHWSYNWRKTSVPASCWVDYRSKVNTEWCRVTKSQNPKSWVGTLPRERADTRPNSWSQSATVDIDMIGATYEVLAFLSGESGCRRCVVFDFSPVTSLYSILFPQTLYSSKWGIEISRRGFEKGSVKLSGPAAKTYRWPLIPKYNCKGTVDLTFNRP